MKRDAKYNIMKGFLNLQQAQCKNEMCKVRKWWKQINKIEHMLQISKYICDKPIINRSQKYNNNNNNLFFLIALIMYISKCFTIKMI